MNDDDERQYPRIVVGGTLIKNAGGPVGLLSDVKVAAEVGKIIADIAAIAVDKSRILADKNREIADLKRELERLRGMK